MFRHRAGRFVLLLILLSAFGGKSDADTVSLAWDPVSHPDLVGYRVYYGTASGNYGQTQDTGLATQTVLGGLTACTDYYVAVKAVASDGSESSLFSNEVTGWPRPIVGSATPASVERGSTIDVAIAGSNFRSGVSIDVSNPGITVDAVAVSGCQQLTLTLSVAANAALGPFDVTVTDANGIVGSGVGVAAVVADTTAPAIANVTASSIGSTSATVTWTTNEPASGQVFFRQVGETVYQQTAIDSGPNSSHSLALNGLTPDTTYEYYVESTDGAGNTSTANGSTTFATSSNAFSYLRFEPENIPLSAPAERVAGADAFAGEWMQLAQGSGTGSPANPNGTWDYGFNLPSGGSWHIWFRMYGINSSSNAWLESTDGGSFSVVEPTQNGQWEWVLATVQNFSAGQHTLTLGGAETRARIDRVLITDDPAFLPSEQPGSDIVPPSAVSGLIATEGDTEVELDWTLPSDSDLERVVVRYRLDGVTPTSPVDGLGLVDRAAVPGAADGETHTGLTNGVTVRYAVFAIDAAGNASPPAAVDATPAVQQAPLGQVQNLRRTDNQ